MIIDEIIKAKEAYYKGNPIMTDSEYDRLEEEAIAQGYKIPVGSGAVDSITKVVHDHPMLSLGKIHSKEEIISFVNDHDTVSMFKMDGLTVSCTYMNGVLTKLETRGDGLVGNDVLFHATSFDNLPKVINKEGKYVVDGEAIIKYDDFEKIGNDQYSNPRNLAAGSLNLLDARESAGRHLRFILWDVIEGGSHGTLSKNLAEAFNLGFEVVRNFLITKEDIYSEYLGEYISFMKKLADEESFPIDGLVFKFDDIQYGKSLGRTEHHFNNAIAYKYEDDKYPTKILNVEWTVGKTGQIVPTLVTEPVEIDGTVVDRASMHNINIFRQFHPTKGATVYIYKANAIIPQVFSVDDDGESEFEIPGKCPVCGGETEVIKNSNSEILYCMNPSCPGKLLGKLVHFVSKKGMDIDGLSEATLEKLITTGLVSRFSDIYKLSEHKDQIQSWDGFGEKSVNKLLAAIEKSRVVDLQHFITALSIPGVGEGQSKIINRVFKSWKDFYDAGSGSYNFSGLYGFGDVLNQNIHSWFDNQFNNSDAVELASTVTFTNGMVNQDPAGKPLVGKTFVITGTVRHFKNRDELKEKIESLGGKVSGSVSSKTSFLINNDVESSSGKNKKAKELGIKIISEEMFMELIK